MENNKATVWQGRVTRQGIRDLNYYGPRRGKAADGAPVVAGDGVEQAKPASSGDAGTTADTGETGAPGDAE